MCVFEVKIVPRNKRTVCNFQVCLVILQYLLHFNTKLVSFQVLHCNFRAQLIDVGTLYVGLDSMTFFYPFKYLTCHDFLRSPQIILCVAISLMIPL